MKRLTTTILSLAIAFAFAFTAFAAKRTVKVGYYRYPGCHMVSDDGKRYGFGYDFYEKLAKYADWSVEYVGYEHPWGDMLPMLERGEVDLVGFVADIPERREKFAYSRGPMAYSGTSLRTMPARLGEFPLDTVESWRRVKVGVMAGDNNEGSFVRFAEDHNLEYEIIRFPDEESAIQEIKADKLDLVAFDSLAPYAGLASVAEFNPVRNHVVTRLSDEALAAEVNAAMKAMSAAEPDWMLKIRSRYYPLTKITAYIPDTMDDATAAYIRTAAIRISEINGWDTEIRNCLPGFRNADFTRPSFACGVVIGPETTRRFEIPQLSIGRRRAELYVRPDDARFTNGISRTAVPYSVGVLDVDVQAREHFERFAADNGIPYRILTVATPDGLSHLLEKGNLDMIVRPSDYTIGLRSVGNCGYIDFFIAPEKGQQALAHSITEALKYLRLDDPGFFPWLENRSFKTEADQRRHVVLGAYVERGLSERDESGEYVGFVNDFADRVGKRAGWNVTPVLMTYPEAQRALADGAIDLMGAVVWTPERARIYDYSKFNIGTLNYALMKRADGRMRENAPDTWHLIKIGLMRGTKANLDLEKYLSDRGVKWRPRYYNNLMEAEAALRRGEVDAVYTLANNRNRDLTTLAVLPTTLCYFCSNKRKPWVKAEMDQAVEDLLREDYRWLLELTEKYLSTDRNVLELSVPEIDYVRSMSGRSVTVTFNAEIPPLVSVDRKTGSVVGFYASLFRRFSERTGVDFKLLPPGSAADVTVTFGDVPAGDRTTITEPSWLKANTCWVKRRGVDTIAHGIVAVPEHRESEIAFIEQSGYTPLIVKGYREGYDAVADGKAEMVIDNLAVARYMLDELHEYPDLNFQPIDPGVYGRNVSLTTSTETDPRLRSILNKCRGSIARSEYDSLVFDSIYSIRPPSVRIETLVWSISALIIVGLLIAVFLGREARIARAASDAKTRFLNSMSHDIRTPLNAITGFTEMARRHSEDTGKVDECLTKIDTASTHLLQLINEVLDMSRVEAGRIELYPRPTNIVQRLEALKVLFGDTVSKKGIKFTVDTSKIHHFWALLDPTRTDQILLNVVGNAVKYTKHGSVSVSCEEVPSGREGYAGYVVKVQDTGIGMSPEFLKHIFDPFSREETSTISGIEGTGLGMSIVRRMMELSGGKVSIESEQGKGTLVTLDFTFKLCDAPAASTAVNKTGNASHASFRGCRILLVEDNGLNREIARFILESMGIVVDEAVDGEEAVQMVMARGEDEGKDYDFVLMDIQMPKMDGYDATRAIRAWEASRAEKSVQRPAIPIIAMTANAFEEDRIEAFKAGMNEHIAKPVKSDVLMSVLRQFL